jgi:hypothetical protein
VYFDTRESRFRATSGNLVHPIESLHYRLKTLVPSIGELNDSEISDELTRLADWKKLRNNS